MAPYNPQSSGAAERGVGLVKVIIKKTREEGSNFEEAFAPLKRHGVIA